MRMWYKVVGAAIGITSVYVAADTLGVELPRPAWSSELKALEVYITSIDERSLEWAIESQQLQLYRNIDRQGMLKDRRQAIPASLRAEQTTLELRLTRLRARLDLLEGIR